MRAVTRRENRPRGRSLKTQQRGTSRSTLFQASSFTGRSVLLLYRCLTSIWHRCTFIGQDEQPTGVIAPEFPRKEVIQPQLPLRLPCYDFTPITDPTFDGSLPCGLGHRLRVLPTFVV